MKKPIEILMNKYGFSLIHTGGGFHCYSKSNHHVLCDDYKEILISSRYSPDAPTSINEKINVGFYSGSNCDLILLLELRSIKYYGRDREKYEQFLIDGKVEF